MTVNKKKEGVILYQTFSDLMKKVGSLDGDISGEKATELSKFYSYWSSYLESSPAFLAFLNHIPGGLAKALYLITASLEHVFNNLFKLFGLFGYLGNQKTLIGQFYHWFQVLGLSVFTFMLMVLAISKLFTKPLKYKDVIVNFIMVTFVTAVLPLAITTFSNALAQDAQSVQTMSNGQKENSSLAVQPFKNNITDLKVLIDNNFNTELFPLDSYGFIKPVQKGSKEINNITDSTDKRDSNDFVTRIDFSAHYGVDNTKLLSDWNDKVKGVKGLLLHKLNANNDGIETVKEHRIVGGLNAFEPIYMRYKVNWVAMFAQYGILIVLLVSMSIKFGKSVFNITVEAMISPLVGYSSVSSNKKYKELLQTIAGAMVGIIMEVIIMRVTLEICRDLPSLSLSAITKLSGGFFDGLNMWEQAISAMIVYIALFLAAMQGVSMIERWLGVSTSHNETSQQLLGAMMAGNAFATGMGAAGRGLFAAGQAGFNFGKMLPGAIGTAGKKIGDSLAVTGGGLSGFVDSVTDQGLGNTLKGGLSNAVNVADAMGMNAAAKAKTSFDEKMNQLDEKAQGSHDSVYNAFKNDALPTNPDSPGAYKDGNLDAVENMPVSSLASDNSQEEQPSSAGETFKGVTDPTVSPKLNHSSDSEFQKSLQQLQHASQRMNQGQNHIKGYESEEEE